LHWLLRFGGWTFQQRARPMLSTFAPPNSGSRLERRGIRIRFLSLRNYVTENATNASANDRYTSPDMLHTVCSRVSHRALIIIHHTIYAHYTIRSTHIRRESAEFRMHDDTTTLHNSSVAPIRCGAMPRTDTLLARGRILSRFVQEAILAEANKTVSGHLLIF